MSKVPAIFLDRDGVLNAVVLKQGKPYPPRTADDCVVLPGVKEALLALKEAGFYLVVVTNQPDVARGTTDLATVTQINDKLLSELPLDQILTCWHDDQDDCECRKPKPGLLLDAATQFELDLNASIMIGDRWRDISAGKGAGVKTIWIDCDYQEKLPDDYDHRVASLPEALPWIFETISIKE